MSEQDEINNVTADIKELANAVSTQTRVANKAWYISMAVALVVLFPPKSAGAIIGEVDLPFKLGSVDGYNFYPVIFALFSVLIVAFATAHAQAVRASNLAHLAIEKIKTFALLDIHPRDLFDMFRVASVNRVAPLAQLLRGKYQFYNKAKDCPAWRRIGTGIYYFILKMIAAAAYWLLPTYAFWLAFLKAQEAGMSILLLIPISLIGFSSLFIVALSDLQYVFETLVILIKPPK